MTVKGNDKKQKRMVPRKKAAEDSKSNANTKQCQFCLVFFAATEEYIVNILSALISVPGKIDILRGADNVFFKEKQGVGRWINEEKASRNQRDTTRGLFFLAD